jgi:hypothetical protein
LCILIRDFQLYSIYVQSKPAWGVLAGLCAWKQELALAEMAYAALGMYEKVLFVRDIKVRSCEREVII